MWNKKNRSAINAVSENVPTNNFKIKCKKLFVFRSCILTMFAKTHRMYMEKISLLIRQWGAK